MEWTEKMVATARRLSLTEKLSAAAIGERMGVTKNAVIGKLRRARQAAAGLPAHPKVTTLKPRFIAPEPPPNPAERYQAMGTEHKPCEFLTGDRREFKTCSKDRVIGKPFCPTHCARSYIKVRPQTATIHSAARREAAIENAARIEEALCR